VTDNTLILMFVVVGVANLLAGIWNVRRLPYLAAFNFGCVAVMGFELWLVVL